MRIELKLSNREKSRNTQKRTKRSGIKRHVKRQKVEKKKRKRKSTEGTTGTQNLMDVGKKKCTKGKHKYHTKNVHGGKTKHIFIEKRIKRKLWTESKLNTEKN